MMIKIINLILQENKYFCYPFRFFSNLAIPLVGLVDTGLMGNLGETKYLAALVLQLR